MKKLSLTVFTTCIIQTMSLCQENLQGVRDDFLKSIASDKDYISYQKSKLEAAYYVASGSWDRDELSKLMNKYPDLNSHCEFPDEELEPIKGGLLWKKTYCTVYLNQKGIREKFKSHNISSEEWEKVLSYYFEIRGYKEIDDLGKRILFNN